MNIYMVLEVAGPMDATGGVGDARCDNEGWSVPLPIYAGRFTHLPGSTKQLFWLIARTPSFVYF